MSSTGKGLALTVICAALTLATPALAARPAKELWFTGPVNLPKHPGPSRSYTPTINLKVRYERGKPVELIRLKAYGTYPTCVAPDGFSYTPGGQQTPEFLQSYKIKRGGFSITQGALPVDDVLTVNARIPRGGRPIAGTLRFQTYLDIGGPHGPFTCDSGFLAWTATRTNDPPDAEDLK